jgi:YHS domain-containing protein
MKKLIVLGLFAVMGYFAAASLNVHAAEEYAVAEAGADGYDVVSYFTESEAVRGSGKHTYVHEGVTYLFSSEENKNAFAGNPEKYLPAYGGYCAYGVALGKKFYSDPEVWEIVDGTLYLNLDRDIQKEWKKDKPGNIKKADANWENIKDKAPGDL